jgi:hypothetical protein
MLSENFLAGVLEEMPRRHVGAEKDDLVGRSNEEKLADGTAACTR